VPAPSRRRTTPASRSWPPVPQFDAEHPSRVYGSGWHEVALWPTTPAPFRIPAPAFKKLATASVAGSRDPVYPPYRSPRCNSATTCSGIFSFRVAPRHSLPSLVLPNLRFDFPGMRARVGPGVYQILRAKTRVCNQQCLLTCAQPAALLKQPNWNPATNDTRLAAAHIRPRVDAWEIVIQLPNHPLKDPSFLPT